MGVIFGNGQDGAATISADTDLGSSNFKQYTNLTVDSTKTLSGNYGMTLYVQQKLPHLTSYSFVSQLGQLRTI